MECLVVEMKIERGENLSPPNGWFNFKWAKSVEMDYESYKKGQYF